jgi:RNA polymerase sigma factor for flagellar operon FliA
VYGYLLNIYVDADYSYILGGKFEGTMTEIEVNQAWDMFFESKAAGCPNEEIKRKLVDHYYGLVQTVANRMHTKLAEVQPDELASMGVDGLYDAVELYDKAFNTKFQTYAMHRIRGSMLDAIRKADWVPRLVRSKCAKLDRQRQILESSAGHRLAHSELAEKLGQNEQDFEDLIKATVTPAIHSVNDLNNDDDGKNMGIDQVEDRGVSQPIDDIIRKELFVKLMGSNFTEQERKIIWLYYFEDRSMKEISESVKLSESRVSQMHGKILGRLKQKAERNPVFFADIWTLLPNFKGLSAV